MRNVQTNGSEIVQVSGENGPVDLIINEDYEMLVQVENVNNGIVRGWKLWDKSNGGSEGVLFYAQLQYEGLPGTPPDSAVKVGQVVLFSRCGNFNQVFTDIDKVEGYSLHDTEENPTKISFICFIGTETFTIIDEGNGKGRPGKLLDGSWAVDTEYDSKELIPSDPLINFHNNTPPFQSGRRYLGKDVGDKYIVYLPGFGDEEQLISQTAGDIVWTLSLDGSGHVLDFTAVTAE